MMNISGLLFLLGKITAISFIKKLLFSQNDDEEKVSF